MLFSNDEKRHVPCSDDDEISHGLRESQGQFNKAGYTAQDAPSTRLKITRDGRTDGRTYGPTDGRTDTPSYRDATAHLKNIGSLQLFHMIS